MGTVRKQTKKFPSHLFAIRMWSEHLGDGSQEWRGQVEHIISKQAHYFRDWSGLVSFLQETLALIEPDAAFNGETPEAEQKNLE